MAHGDDKDILNKLPLIEQGTVIQVNDAGGGLKYISRFVGIDGQIIITRLPAVSQLKKSGMGTDELTYRDTFFSKRKLVMRMIFNGRVYAFETEVVDLFMQGGKLLISSYPKQIQARSLRKEPRYPCAIPATLTVGATVSEGLMVNFSSGGGLFQFTAGNELDTLAQAREQDQECQLCLQLPFDESPAVIRSKIRSLALNDMQVGLAFSDGKDLIHRYISALKLDSISAYF